MTEKNQLRANPVAESRRISQFLVNWITLPDLATLEEVDSSFGALGQVIEALPPTRADLHLMGYLRNRLRSSFELFQAGEWGAARYQLTEMNRKLARLG